MYTEGRARNLIASDKESGKAVYGAANKKIGSIEKVMIDKTTGGNGLGLAELRRLSRYRHGAISGALEGAQIRQRSRRLSFRNKRKPPERRAKARHRDHL